MKKDKAFNPVDGKLKSAKARKLDAEAERMRLEAREREDQQWRDTKSRATKRREEKAERQSQASARKASARLLAKQEEEDLERMLNFKKVTTEELQRKREAEEQAAIQKKVEEKMQRKSRVATKKEYEKMILVENKNRSVIEAHSINEAIEVLTVKENLKACKVMAAEGNKGDCLFVYTQGDKKPLLVDFRLIV